MAEPANKRNEFFEKNLEQTFKNNTCQGLTGFGGYFCLLKACGKSPEGNCVTADN